MKKKTIQHNFILIQLFLFHLRKGGVLSAHFQIRGTSVPDILLEACRGELDLSRTRSLESTTSGNIPHKIIQLHKCRELTAVFKEEQIARKKQYETIEVSDEHFNLTKFIIEAINCEVRMRPEFEEANESLVRKMEYFPTRPVVRKQVLYQQDLKNYTQIQRLMDEQSRESGDTTPIEFSGPTTQSHTNLEQTKESEKGEFEDSNIVCKNYHSAKKSVTPGMFVFSCIHHVILGKSLPLFSLLGPKIGSDCHVHPKLILIN